MLYLKNFVFNAFQENTFLLWDEQTSEAVIVDPGCYEDHEFQEVEAFLSENKLTLTCILNTHCHIDHVLGIPYFKENYKLAFKAHQGESAIAKNAHMMGKIFGLEVDRFPDIDSFIEHREEICIGASSIVALHVPGHSMGSLAFYSQEDGFVLTGDALFEGSIGRTDLPGGNYDQLIQSISENLLTLPPETRVYPGHGPSSSIGAEKESNPFLRAS